jgi:hypothetical protein
VLDPPDARTCANTCATDAGPGDAGPSFCPKPKGSSPPGPSLTSRTAMGTGACAGRALGTVLDALYVANPTLASITTIYDPSTTLFDGSFVYAFAIPDGFAIALKRGGGDCPAGCTENEYWYFESDASCTPRQVGHYHPTYGSACVNVDGAPMWATPAPLDPASVCAADTTARNISGTYVVCATGNRTACTPKAGAEPTTPLNANLTVTIAQRAEDLSMGTVTVTGTGHSLIDGVPFDATFERRRFSVTKSFDNLPSSCIDQWQFSMQLDFEGVLVPGHLSLFEVHGLDCSGSTQGDYCKGQIGLELYTP